VPGGGAMHGRGARHLAAPLGAAAADPGTVLGAFCRSGSGFSWNFMDFHGFSRMFKDVQVIFMDFVREIGALWHLELRTS
jgi:hypothetical protein